VPAHTMDRKPALMENMALFETMEHNVEKETDEIKDRIIDSFANGKLPNEIEVFDTEFLEYMKKMKMQMDKEKRMTPPLSAFNIDPGNQIIKHLENNQLLNRQEDRVKVIYYPSYVSVVDGLLNMNYYDSIIGCHVGVFPSYYESWGYTPLETAALGAQSITTDLSGFGKFILSKTGKNGYAIHVLPREGKTYDEAVSSLTSVLHTIYKMSKKRRNECKIEAKNLAGLSDWKILIGNYMKAYEMAMGKKS
jgi:glycogen(starch) synthase